MSEPPNIRAAKGARKKQLHERTGARVPKPAVVCPPRPPGLNAVAGLMWDKLSKQLYDTQVLTTYDVWGLERICRLWAEVQYLARYIDDNGTVSETINARGEITTKTRPEVNMYAACDARLLSYMANYGLTPAARNRVSAQGEPQDSGSPEAQYFQEAA